MPDRVYSSTVFCEQTDPLGTERCCTCFERSNDGMRFPLLRASETPARQPCAGVLMSGVPCKVNSEAREPRGEKSRYRRHRIFSFAGRILQHVVRSACPRTSTCTRHDHATLEHSKKLCRPRRRSERECESEREVSFRGVVAFCNESSRQEVECQPS